MQAGRLGAPTPGRRPRTALGLSLQQVPRATPPLSCAGVQAPPGAAPRPLLQGRDSAFQGSRGEDTSRPCKCWGKSRALQPTWSPPSPPPRMAPKPELGADRHWRRRPSSSARGTQNRPGLSAAPSPGPAWSPARGRGPTGVTQGPAPCLLLRGGCPEQPCVRQPPAPALSCGAREVRSPCAWRGGVTLLPVRSSQFPPAPFSSFTGGSSSRKPSLPPRHR